MTFNGWLQVSHKNLKTWPKSTEGVDEMFGGGVRLSFGGRRRRHLLFHLFGGRPARSRSRRSCFATFLGGAVVFIVIIVRVEDFPLFEWDNNESKWDASHHAFCMPKEGYREYLYSDPGKVIAESYDLVCNGYEVASGSIRVHHRSLQEQIFRVLGYSDDQMDERFSQLLNALEYGAPPHGGIAPGIDRIAMILLGRESIRDVIAFPKTQSQIDPLFEAPSAVEAAQLDELGIRIVE